MLAAVAALATIAACGSGVNEVAATTTYNARFVGIAYYHTASTSPTLRMGATMTLSQLTSTVTGSILVVDSGGVAPDTVLAAGVTGRTTNDGLDLTIVRVAGCALHLNGPLVLANGALAGTLVGSDCNASGQNDISLDLLVSRQ